MKHRAFWLANLRRYEKLKLTCDRPDRVQECIDRLIEEGISKGWY